MPPATLAIDFGTSNSAAAIPGDGGVRRIPVEDASDTLPTAVFFPAHGGGMRIGAAAAAALVEGEEGRYMRALKSALGDPLLHEARRIGGRRRTLEEVIAAFLAEVKRRAEAATGRRFDRALSGRPVRFHHDPERDARAEADLRGCYLAAGFEEVAFRFEPEAAALACHGLRRPGETGLIVDIGGGTSDFSVFRAEAEGVRILASHGIRLGGADFDHWVSMTHAMPLLGLGGLLRSPMAREAHPAPNAIYADLSTWAKIPFLYAPETRRAAAAMAREALEPAPMTRLSRVLENELGHELAFAVERGKIAANGGGRTAAIELGFLEPDLRAPIDEDSLGQALEGARAQLAEAMREALSAAGVAPADIGSAVLVGGSSLMRLVSDEAQALCPNARLERAEAFTAVVDGLALAAR